MKSKLEIEMNDVYGGDGFYRTQKMEKLTFSRKKKKTTTKEDIGVSVDRDISEQNTEIVDEKINTFRLVDGEPVLRLGGSHGKLWGAMRATGRQLADLGEIQSKSFVDRLMNMVQIIPVYTKICDGNFLKKIGRSGDIIKIESIGGSNENHRVESIFTKMGGFGNSAIPVYHDVIEKSNVEMILNYPKQIKDIVNKMVYGLENGTHMNKMRTSIKILDFTEVEE